MRNTTRMLHLGLIIICAAALVGTSGEIVSPAHAAPAASNIRVATTGLTSGACGGTWETACSLQHALNDIATSGDEIWVAAGTYTPTTGSDPNATFTLPNGVGMYGGFAGGETARGQRNWTTHVTTLSGNLSGGAHSLHVVTTDGTTLATVLDGFTVTGGQVSGGPGGGVLVNNGSLTIANCRIANNSAEWGGGVFQEGASGRLNVTGSRIELNTSAGQGGGIFVRGSVALTDTLVLSNTTSLYGGGLHVDSGRADLVGGLFSNNRALGDNGGGVNANNSVSITGTQFISNTTNDSGGALLQWNAEYTVTIVNARFERNTAKSEGGGASIAGTLIISNSTFMTNTVDSGNTNDTYGGGVYAGGTSRIYASTFVSNTAWCELCSFTMGGGICASQPTTIQDSTFERNFAWDGGGVATTNSTITVTHSTFKNNAAGYGGALNSRTIRATETDFLNNRAVNDGGGLSAAYITLLGGRFISNTASSVTGVGGSVRVTANLAATNTLFAGNQGGGGAALQLAGTQYTLVHVTIAHPAQGSGPAILLKSGTAAITDTIIANYTVGISQTGGTLSADYDLFFTTTPTQTAGGTMNWGSHNLINTNPRFVNPAAGNYHLAAGSPAIDAGVNAGVTTDLDGLARPMGVGYDIGAYEYRLTVYLPLVVRNH